MLESVYVYAASMCMSREALQRQMSEDGASLSPTKPGISNPGKRHEQHLLSGGGSHQHLLPRPRSAPDSAPGESHFGAKLCKIFQLGGIKGMPGL